MPAMPERVPAPATEVYFAHLGTYADVARFDRFGDAIAAAAAAIQTFRYESGDRQSREFVAAKQRGPLGEFEVARWELLAGQPVLIPTGQGGLTAEQAAALAPAARRAGE